MHEIYWFLITVIVAATGGIILYKLNFPAGMMVGALICVGALSIITGNAYMPKSVKVVTKTVTGLFVGMNMTIDMVRNLKKLFKPAIVLVVLIISLCFGMGVFLYYLTGIDVVTALFCVAPGGMTDMTLMTMDMGGDAAVVAVLQVMRLLTVYCISMPLVKWTTKKADREEEVRNERIEKAAKPIGQERRRRISLTVCVATIGGTVGYILSKCFDFGVLILLATMICAAVNIKTGKLYMPRSVRRVTQIFSGALIGTSVTYESLVNLQKVIVPAVFLCCGFVLINQLLARVIHKVCKIDLVTAMLSTSAGGASESALVAADFGADPSIVSVLQISRMVCTTAFYPLVVQLLYQLL